LACVMPIGFWRNIPTMVGYFLVVFLTCVTTATTALFCSTIFQKSATSLISTYLVIGVMFLAPVAVNFFAETFFRGTTQAAMADKVGIVSPFAATFDLPLDIHDSDDVSVTAGASPNSGGQLFFGFVGWSILYNTALVLAMTRLFQVRWRVAD